MIAKSAAERPLDSISPLALLLMEAVPVVAMETTGCAAVPAPNTDPPLLLIVVEPVPVLWSTKMPEPDPLIVLPRPLVIVTSAAPVVTALTAGAPTTLSAVTFTPLAILMPTWPSADRAIRAPVMVPNTPVTVPLPVTSALALSVTVPLEPVAPKMPKPRRRHCW